MIRFLFFAGLRSKCILLTTLLLAAFHLTRAQELKLGSNPTVINKASILELESTSRGLLLPRIPDTTVAPLTTAPSGMIIYFTVDSSLYVRKGGAWQKVVDKKYLTGLLAGSGTVTSVSASVPAGMNVTVATPTTTPNIAVTTALNGPVRGTGSGFTTGATSLTSEVSGILPIANGGTGLGTLGSAGQQLQVNPAGTGLQYFTTTGTAPITYSSGTIGITQAGATTSGYLSSTDWNTFNNKQGAIITGNLTETGSNILTITGGAGAQVGGNTTIQVKQAGSTQSGFLSNTDWNTFNNKLSAIDTTNINQFSLKVRSLFSAGSGLSYNPTTGTFTNTAAATYWQYGGNAVTANQNLGTTSAFDLPIITNGTERMRVLSTGNVGIGLTNPAYALGVLSSMEIRRPATAGTMAQLLFSNVAGTGDFRIGSDGQDIYWQGGGGRNLEMGAYWGTFLTGDRQASTFPSFVNGTTGTAVTAFSSRAASVPFAVLGTTGQTANLQEWRSSTGTLNVMNSNGNLAIGATSFDPTNPEKVLINAGTTSSVNALYLKGTINNYFQVNIRNLSNGNIASSDLVATADNGTETTNFMDMGINGSGYVYQNGAAIETGKANDTYLLAAGNDFYIVNNNATKSMIFLSGGTASTDETMRLTASNRVGIATSNPTDTLTVAGPFRMGANGTRLNYIIRGTVPLSSATNVGGGGGVLDITGAVANVTTGSTVSVSPLSALPAGISIAYAWVSSAGNVTIRLLNSSVTIVGLPVTVNVPATTFAVTVTQ